MKKKIVVRFEYDGTTQGNTDRDAFKAAWDTEVTKATVVPVVTHGVNVETAAAVVSGNVVTGLIFYNPDNAGIADWNSFWTTVQTEYAKATVVKTDGKSTGEKHDCYHDSVGGCKNFVYLT